MIVPRIRSLSARSFFAHWQCHSLHKPFRFHLLNTWLLSSEKPSSGTSDGYWQIPSMKL